MNYSSFDTDGITTAIRNTSGLVVSILPEMAIGPTLHGMVPTIVLTLPAPFRGRMDLSRCCMLGMPEPTAYDVRFRLLGIPVRVHPLFWLVTAMMGGAGGDETLGPILIWIGCVFVSILVHEYGHGLTARSFRYAPSIVLYGMGGLCYSESERQTPWQRLAVLLAGPGAGLLFYGLIELGLHTLGIPESRLAREILGDLIQINLFWSLFNLLPIWPLDGGQITGVLLSMLNRRKGMNWAHVVSLVTAALVAMMWFKVNQLFMGIFFALLAVMNFQILQAHHHTAKYGAMDDDADWWKR
jgi:Zn-dependent protease